MQEKIELNLIELSKIPIDTLKKIPTELEPTPGLIDKNKISGFKSANINNVAELIRFFPKKYIERDHITDISEIREKSKDQEVTITGFIEDMSVFTTRTKLRITTFKIRDHSGFLSAKWFGPQYVERRFKKEENVFITGKFEIKKNGSIEMKNPYIEINDYNFEEDNIAFIPIYQKVRNNSPAWIRKKYKEIFDKTNDFDPMPQGLREKYNLLGLKKAYEKIHFPTDLKESSEARKRLVVDEFMYLQAFFHESKELNRSKPSGFQHTFSEENIKLYINNLGFLLTKSQMSAIEEITRDMESKVPMKRLLQGDVGSGKTVVAVYSLIFSVLNGYQSAFMAPTEVLAEQHYKTVVELCKLFDIEVHLITSSKKNKTEIQEKIKNGHPAIYIGTHALIQDKVSFSQLSFVVIDEQHRFGVEQRSKLSASISGQPPDILFMTATPIPRTTALTVYGDLDISIMKDMPEGRLEVITSLHEGLAKNTKEVYAKVLSHINNKAQVFIVCPFIEESEKLDIKAAESVFEEYKKEFPNNVVEILHGRMDSIEKDEVMKKMKAGKIDVLISTVVVEVGIDIENASLMVIESAERFGLSQLHQLRGRVGRGSQQSECILHLSSGKKIDTITDEGKERIEAAIMTSDGFQIAEYDFQIRGEGTVLGGKQSGSSEMKIANLRTDLELLLIAKEIFNDSAATASFKSFLLEEAKIFLPHFNKLLLG